MKRVKSNHRPNHRSEWSNALFLLALLAAVLLLVPSRTDGQIQWTKDARNPIMSGGAYGTWNRHVLLPCVLFNADSARYEMWFSASTGIPTAHPIRVGPCCVGYASSNDGINWTILDGPVLEPDAGTWDNQTIEAPIVLRENGQYKMWYVGWGNDRIIKVGYATSPDGITWTKYAGNPVMTPGTALWEDAICGPGAVIPYEGGYQMWYIGGPDPMFSVYETNVGYATSVDGIHWQRDESNNPVLSHGAPAEFDGAYINELTVNVIGTTYYMYYTGMTSLMNKRVIGLATSVDGVHWTKHSGPVLSPTTGQWDGNHVEVGSLLLVGDTLHMWYDGTREDPQINLWRIGHAISPGVPVGIEDYDHAFMPGEYLLAQNYPNPFNPVSTIRYELSEASHVSLFVYDVSGREVARLVDGTMEAGYHEVQWDGSKAASGVYIARLVAREYSQSIKMLLLK
ncbi:MAG: T9SS type A sorting domain-containing protein [Fidelibacterota bacterium]|nr:MAG: T9SS type A sorting domain-containing protein [Candidatus Neomarinimicrobiota bacterium]